MHRQSTQNRTDNQSQKRVRVTCRRLAELWLAGSMDGQRLPGQTSVIETIGSRASRGQTPWHQRHSSGSCGRLWVSGTGIKQDTLCLPPLVLYLSHPFFSHGYFRIHQACVSGPSVFERVAGEIAPVRGLAVEPRVPTVALCINCWQSWGRASRASVHGGQVEVLV